MDFFKRQEIARKKTGRLVVYFVISVFLIIGAVYFAVILFLKYLEKKEKFSFTIAWWDDSLFIGITVFTLCIVSLGTLYKIWQLRKGGRKIAEMLGGRPLSPDTKIPEERRLLNVVEEMAIASGVPVPSVFLLEEKGINAFAAGFSPTDCVIGVTKGCMELLSRDELQGVIAHEFSHILNGDMRLNLRLMGTLNGILVIALIGQVLLRSGGRSSGSKKGGNPLPLLGLLLLVIGYVGVFFGKLIKAAVSRQREFLADSSAVQFTRNPGGIEGALKKIGGFTSGSRLETPKAEELSHFYFANGLRESWLKWLATHPPLDERIKSIDPQFDGKFPKGIAKAPVEEDGGGGPESLISSMRGENFSLSHENVAAKVGAPQPIHLDYAANLIAALPQGVKESSQNVEGAKELIYAMLSKESELKPKVEGLDPQVKLALVDLALPALRKISKQDYDLFRKEIHALVMADSKIDLFEFALEKILFKNLGPLFEKEKSYAPRYESLDKLKPECVTLLSCLARNGQNEEAQIQQAFEAGWGRLGFPKDSLLLMDKECNFEALSKALDPLALTVPLRRRQLLEACVACIAADKKVTAEEAALVRAIAATLDCPLPPFVATNSP